MGNLVEYAISIGNLNLIKWVDNFTYNPHYVCETATYSGHLEVLKWPNRMVILGMNTLVHGLHQRDTLKC